MTVLVTGGTGVIGRWVVRALAADADQVHVVGRTVGTSALLAGVVAHDVDLLQRSQRQLLLEQVQPREVVHLAWETTHGHFWDSPLNQEWEEATVELVRHARELGAERVVVAGTCAEYDWSDLDPADGLCTEGSTALRATSSYGRAKARALERLSSLPDADAWLGWGRIFSPYGPGEAPARLVPSLVTALLDGRRAQVANPGLVRDYLHAEEVGRGFVALLRSQVGGAVNVASGQPVSLGQLARQIGEVVGRPDLVQLGEGSPRPGEPVRLVADVSRLKQEVGFHPDADLVVGLRNVVAWWRARRP